MARRTLPPAHGIRGRGWIGSTAAWTHPIAKRFAPRPKIVPKSELVGLDPPYPFVSSFKHVATEITEYTEEYDIIDMFSEISVSSVARLLREMLYLSSV